MSLFKKKEKEIVPPQEESGEEVRAEETESAAAAEAKPLVFASYRSGRLAGVYLKMYLWVFSVSLNYDSYQLESGRGQFAGGDFPLRGHYSELFEKLLGQVVPEQANDFSEMFAPKTLGALFMEGHSFVSGLFYARLCEGEDEGEAQWYEFRAERIPSEDEKRLQFIFYIRFALSGSDTGKLPKREKPPTEETVSEYDWEDVRIRRILRNERVIYYEYDIKNDTLYTHRVRGDKKTDHIDKSFIGSLHLRGDFLISHENISDVVNLFRTAADGVQGEAEIKYRKDGMDGAEFIYYKLTCQPLEERGTPTWLMGSLTDIDEKVKKRQQSNEVMHQMDMVLSEFYTRMYLINTNQGSVYSIVRDEAGFQYKKEPHSLGEIIQSEIQSGVISEQSVKEYKEWVKPDFLQRKTAKGNYEFEAYLKLPGTKEYRWYMDTVTPMTGRPGTFMRMRRDITETRQARQAQYVMAEQARFAEYNRSVLDVMANLVEFRNIENGQHIVHVRELTKILLLDLVTRSPEYHITQKIVDLYTEAATIHDIGKVTIPDSILNKAGKLTVEEYEKMKTHTTMGEKIVQSLNMPGLEDLKECCRDVVLHHHERFDGGGYPEGLKGDEIHIGVQAVSLADTYDALVSERCYKDMIPFDEAKEMILTGKCGAFNPKVLETLKAVEGKMRALYELEIQTKEEA